MNDDCLKLSCYFGERHRTRKGFVADQLLGLYGDNDIAVSIMMRGVEGFGLKHHLRSDHSLTLSEDLPAVAIAVDTRPRIEKIIGRVANLTDIGLITLERARLIDGYIVPITLPGNADDATKLTIYLGRQERIYRVPAFIAVCDLLHRRGIAGATVLLGVDGTTNGHRERAHFFGRNADVPMMVIAIGADTQIHAVLAEIGALLRRPLMTLERVRICKRDGELLGSPHELPGTDEHGMAIWQKLSIFTSEAAQHHGQPIHRAITRRLRENGSSGVTSLRGIWGFHGDHEPHGDRPLQLGRHVPTVTVVIDTPDKITAAFPVIDELTTNSGLITSEMVPAARTRAGHRGRGGLRMANHQL